MRWEVLHRLQSKLASSNLVAMDVDSRCKLRRKAVGLRAYLKLLGKSLTQREYHASPNRQRLRLRSRHARYYRRETSRFAKGGNGSGYPLPRLPAP